MIEVLLVDDHAAVRAGLIALLRLEPGFVPVAAVETGAAAIDQGRHRRPDVALVDYHLPDADGLTVCRSLRALDAPPQVVIYSAFADDLLALPAALAGAHSVISKTAPSERLFDALRSAARGGDSLLRGPRLLGDAGRSIEVDDRPLLGMLADGTPVAQIAGVLDLPVAEVERRIDDIIETLKLRLDGGLAAMTAAAPSQPATES